MSNSAGVKNGQPGPARTLASGIASLDRHDDTTLDEMFRRASALYQAAYAPRRGSGSEAEDSQETLIRMALPWHMAPRLLARMKLYDSFRPDESSESRMAEP